MSEFTHEELGFMTKLIEDHQASKHQEINDKLVGMYNYHNDCEFGHKIQCSRFDFETLFFSKNYDEYNLWKYDRIDQLFQTLHQNQYNEHLICSLILEHISMSVVTCDNVVWYFADGKWINDKGDMLWNMITWGFLNILRKHGFEEGVMFLSKISVRERIIVDLKKRLHYSEFTRKLNSIKHLLGVQNGTLDLNTLEVRPTTSTDFISMNTKIPFNVYPEECTELSILFKILDQIFPDPTVLSFFLRSCSTFLEGENSCKKLFIWWGMGNNVKTGMQSLVNSALGEYCGTGPVSMITSKRTGSSNATPHLAHLENKLVVFLQEPNQKEELRTGQIKELTGNDKVYIRGLYEKNAREIDIKCKLVLVVNYPNVGQSTDPAFKRRVVVIPFDSIFIPEAEYLSKKEKGVLRDNTFVIVDGMDSVFKALGPVFLWVLTKEFQAFKQYGMVIEKVIQDKTEEFLTYNNYCLKYIRKNLRHIPSTSISNGIKSDIIYEVFKNFMRNMYPGKAIPTNETFCKELIDEDFIISEDGVVYDVEIQNYEINTPF